MADNHINNESEQDDSPYSYDMKLTPAEPYESPAFARNPSPPSELLELQDDSVCNSAYSKHWIFSTLMKLLKAFDEQSKPTLSANSTDTEHNEQPGNEQPSDPGGAGDKLANSESKTEDGEKRPQMNGSTTQTSDQTSDEILDKINISDELQTELGELWDMSSDEEVAKLLLEYQADAMLSQVVLKSCAPRLTEISLGILGNMACCEDTCKKMLEQSSVMYVCVETIDSDDTPSLIESTRLLNTLISNCRDEHHDKLELVIRSEFVKHITFILNSSTNADLLLNVSDLVDKIFDIDDLDVVSTWFNDDFINGLVSAFDQFKEKSRSDVCCNIMHILQLISSRESQYIHQHQSIVTSVIIQYLNSVCSHEIVSLEDRKMYGVASSLNLINLLIENDDAPENQFYKGDNLIRYLLDIIHVAVQEKSQLESTHLYKFVLHDLTDLLKRFINLLHSEMEKIQADAPQDESDSCSSTDLPSTLTKPLKYLNRKSNVDKITSLQSFLEWEDDSQMLERLIELTKFTGYKTLSKSLQKGIKVKKP